MTVKIVYKEPLTGITGFTALSTDTMPSATPGSWVKFTNNRDGATYNGSEWVVDIVGGAKSVTTGGAPKELVTPTVGGTNKSSVTLAAGTGGIPAFSRIIKLSATIDSMDDLEAGTLLANGYPDVFNILPGTKELVPSPDTAMTRVSCIAHTVGALGTDAGSSVGRMLAHAIGTVTLDTGASGSVDGITVDSVEIMSGAEAFDTSLVTTATNVAANITANTSIPNYTAAANGAVITITADTGGAESNGFVVTSSVTTITTTDTDMAGTSALIVSQNLVTFEFLQSDNVRLMSLGLTDNGTPGDSQILCGGWKND